MDHRLPPEIKAVRAASLEALRRYAANGTACRRAALLAHFGETAPAWGARGCGTCDACERKVSNESGVRDFTELSLLLLEASRTEGSGASNGKVLKCAHSGCKSAALVARRSQVPSRTGRGPSADLLKEMLPQLVTAGYLARATASFEQAGGRNISYETLTVTPAGQRLLGAHSASSSSSQSVNQGVSSQGSAAPPPRAAGGAARRARSRSCRASQSREVAPRAGAGLAARGSRDGSARGGGGKGSRGRRGARGK